MAPAASPPGCKVRASPPSSIADTGAPGFDSAPGSAVAIRQSLAGWGITASAETGAVLSPRDRLLPGRAQWQHTPYTRAGIALDRAFGPVRGSAALTRLDEQGTVLGARFDAALGTPGATSWLFDTGARLDAGRWTVGGTMRRGWTDARLHGIAGGGRLHTSTWSVDVGRAGLAGNDSLGLRIAQPLRVASGGLDLTLPTLWDYATGTVATFTTQRLGLAPAGRELDAEIRYARALGGGTVQTNLYWRRDPGNVAALRPDMGAALRWSRGF